MPYTTPRTRVAALKRPQTPTLPLLLTALASALLLLTAWPR